MATHCEKIPQVHRKLHCETCIQETWVCHEVHCLLVAKKMQMKSRSLQHQELNVISVSGGWWVDVGHTSSHTVRWSQISGIVQILLRAVFGCKAVKMVVFDMSHSATFGHCNGAKIKVINTFPSQWSSFVWKGWKSVCSWPGLDGSILKTDTTYSLLPRLQNTPFSHLFSNLLMEFDDTVTYGLEESCEKIKWEKF